MKAKDEELRKAQAMVMRLKGKLIKSRDAAVTEASELKAKLEATEDQERIATAFAVLEFQASDEIRQVKDSNYDQGVQDSLYTMVTA